MNNHILKSAKARQRKEAIEAGFYDGRYKKKIVSDKKKEHSKNKCRKYKPAIEE